MLFNASPCSQTITLLKLLFCVSRKMATRKATRYEQSSPMAEQPVSYYSDLHEIEPDDDIAQPTGNHLCIHANINDLSTARPKWRLDGHLLYSLVNHACAN